MYCSCTVGRRETNPPHGESEFLPSPNRCSSGRISFPQKPAGRSDVQTSRLERVADVGVERVVLTFVAAGTERVVDAEREGVLLSRKTQGCLHRRAVNNAGDDFGGQSVVLRRSILVAEGGHHREVKRRGEVPAARLEGTREGHTQGSLEDVQLIVVRTEETVTAFHIKARVTDAGVRRHVDDTHRGRQFNTEAEREGLGLNVAAPVAHAVGGRDVALGLHVAEVELGVHDRATLVAVDREAHEVNVVVNRGGRALGAAGTGTDRESRTERGVILSERVVAAQNGMVTLGKTGVHVGMTMKALGDLLPGFKKLDTDQKATIAEGIMNLAGLATAIEGVDLKDANKAQQFVTDLVKDNVYTAGHWYDWLPWITKDRKSIFEFKYGDLGSEQKWIADELAKLSGNDRKMTPGQRMGNLVNFMLLKNVNIPVGSIAQQPRVRNKVYQLVDQDMQRDPKYAGMSPAQRRALIEPAMKNDTEVVRQYLTHLFTEGE